MSHLEPDMLRPGAALDDAGNGLVVNGDLACLCDGQVRTGSLNHISSLPVQHTGCPQGKSKEGPHFAPAYGAYALGLHIAETTGL